MSKYIDYDAIDYRHYKLYDKSSEFLDGVIYMAERIEDAPSIDIVRCGECKLGGTEDCPMDEIYSENFCSYGERKDEPQTDCSACDTCQWYNSGIPCGVEPGVCKREVKDEPQTETHDKHTQTHECVMDEPQTERSE